MNIYNLITEYQDVYAGSDEKAIAIVTAVALSHYQSQFEYAIHLCITGDSGSGKTSLITKLPETDFDIISQISKNGLVSAFDDGKFSFLKENKNYAIVMQDFTAVLEEMDTIRKAILKNLRLASDGIFNKQTGNAMKQKWKGKLTFITSCTLDIYQKEREIAKSGRRFVYYEMKPLKNVSFREINKADNARIEEAFYTFFLFHKDWVPPELTDEEEYFVSMASKAYTWMRSFTYRDSSSLEHTVVKDEVFRIQRTLRYIAKTLKYMEYPMEDIILSIIESGSIKANIEIYNVIKNMALPMHLIQKNLKDALKENDYRVKQITRQLEQINIIQSFDDSANGVRLHKLNEDYYRTITWYTETKKALQ